jgi:hypothetical protein
VRVYTAQVAPEVSGTVVSLHITDTYFVHKGDVLFQAWFIFGHFGVTDGRAEWAGR